MIPQRKMKRLKDAWDGFIDKGVFSVMSESGVIEPGPLSEFIKKYNFEMDVLYYGRSGIKNIATLPYEFLEKDGQIAFLRKQLLAQVIASQFSQKWDRYLSAMTKEYDPTKPYLMHEVSDGTDGRTKKDKFIKNLETKTKTGSIKETNGGQLKEDTTGNPTYNDNVIDKTTDSNEYKNAFDDLSLEGDPTGQSKTKENGLTEGGQTLDEHVTTTDTRTKETTYNEYADITNREKEQHKQDDGHFHTEKTFDGNIGNIPPQLLIDKELDLDARLDLFEIMFKDVDSVLVDNIFLPYEEEEEVIIP